MTHLIVAPLFALLALLAPQGSKGAPGQAGAPGANGNDIKELADLKVEYKKARDEYMKPLANAKTPEEKKNVKLDPEKNPAKKYVGKFAALAARAKGTDVGCEASTEQLRALMSIAGGGSTPTQAPAATPEMEKLIDATTTTYLTRDFFVPFMQVAAQALRGPKADAFYEKLVAKSTSPVVRGEARFQIAFKLYNSAGKDEAKKKEAYEMLALVAKETPESTSGKRAAGIVFEHEHLQIGMAAPDFTAKDQDGKDFKLSDYRGKVVLLDFWGFW